MQWPPTRPGLNGRKFHFVPAAAAACEKAAKLKPVDAMEALDAAYAKAQLE